MIATFIGIYAVTGHRLAPGWRVAFFVLGGAAILCLLLTEPVLRKRRWTLHVGRAAEGGIRIWLEPPAKPLLGTGSARQRVCSPWRCKVIWPIIARYMVAFAAGFTWHIYPLAAKVLWVVILVAMVAWDTREALRRDLQGSRSGQRAGELGEDRQVGVQPNAVKTTDDRKAR